MSVYCFTARPPALRIGPPMRATLDHPRIVGRATLLTRRTCGLTIKQVTLRRQDRAVAAAHRRTDILGLAGLLRNHELLSHGERDVRSMFLFGFYAIVGGV